MRTENFFVSTTVIQSLVLCSFLFAFHLWIFTTNLYTYLTGKSLYGLRLHALVVSACTRPNFMSPLLLLENKDIIYCF
jgi:hypothetical protein